MDYKFLYEKLLKENKELKERLNEKLNEKLPLPRAFPSWTESDATKYFRSKGIKEFSKRVINREEVLKYGNVFKELGYFEDDDPTKKLIAVCPNTLEDTQNKIKSLDNFRPKSETEHNWLVAKQNKLYDLQDKLTAEDYKINPEKYTSYISKSGKMYKLDKSGNRIYRDKQKEKAWEKEAGIGNSQTQAQSQSLIDKVKSYYDANKDRPDRNHGENWLRVLIAFGVKTHPTLKPYTAAEARESEKIWKGWREISEALEKLEKNIKT